MVNSVRIILVCLTMVFFSAVFCSAASAEGIWSLAGKDCKVWNPDPQSDETVTWSGKVDREGYATGPGVLQWYLSGKPNGKFEGQMLKGKESGKGVITWADGSRYDGELLDSQETGKGILTSPEGFSYNGDFVNDMLSGKGVFTWADGSRYEGDFLDSKRTGKGVFIWGPKSQHNGDRYEGDFVDGRHTGKGIYTWADGSRYEGDFVADDFQGYGTLYAPNGSILFQGKWVKGKFVGK